MDRNVGKTEEKLYEEFLKEWNNDELTVTVQTSGSTGTPKKIGLKKSYMRRSALRTVRFFDLNPDSMILSCMSFKYIGGKMMIVRSLETGCRLAVETPSLEPMKTLTEDLTLVALVPVQMEYVLDNLERLPKVKHYLIGGSALNDALRKRIVAAGLSAWESYAMTETASHIAIRKVEYDADGKVRPFYPLEDVKLSPDEHNRLIIKDGDEEPLVTNDIVEFTPDGGFFVLGRADDMIITGGRKVLPQTIEEIVSKYLPEDIKIAVAGLPDDKWGEKITLVIETDSLKRLNEEDVRNLAAKSLDSINEETLPRWMRPKDITTIPSLPRNENGKLQRGLLKSMV